MSDGGNRIGTVSSVDPETGMVSVLFEDRDGEVTELLPYATFNEEYKLPQLGAKVVVIHLSNGGEMGIILGTYWNEYNAAGNPGTFHKDLGGGAYINYKDGVLTVAASNPHSVLRRQRNPPGRRGGKTSAEATRPRKQDRSFRAGRRSREGVG